MSDKAEQKEEKLKAYYGDDQNQCNSCNKGQNLLPSSSSCINPVALYSLELYSIHTSKTGSII